MNDNIEVSILITTYNLEKYIEKTLESVINQKVSFNYEIIVGDDGSSDSTAELVKKWMEKYPDIISLYVMPRDKDIKYSSIDRASKNRINILKKARGKYFAFLDGDDFYSSENKLQMQYDILEDAANSDVVMCGHNVWLYYDEENKSKLGKIKKAKKMSPEYYWKNGWYMSTDSLLIRNLIELEKANDIIQGYFDDNIIAFYMLDKGKVMYIPDTMVCYRQHESSLWNQTIDIEKNLINLRDYDIELKINPNMEKASIKRHLFNWINLRKNYKKIPNSIRAKYAEEAEQKGFLEVKFMLEFENKSFGEKLKFDCRLLKDIIVSIPSIIQKIRINIG